VRSAVGAFRGGPPPRYPSPSSRIALNLDLQLIKINGREIFQAVENFQGSDTKTPINECVKPNKEALAVALEDDLGLLASCRGPCSQAVWMAKTSIVSVRVPQLGERGELTELRIEQPAILFGYQQ
jgi:hypothetical protein